MPEGPGLINAEEQKADKIIESSVSIKNDIEE